MADGVKMTWREHLDATGRAHWTYDDFIEHLVILYDRIYGGDDEDDEDDEYVSYSHWGLIAT